MSSILFQDIGLRPAQLKAIEKKARQAGKTAAEYVRWMIERDLLADRSFNSILEPVRKDFRKAGVTADQLDAIVTRARRSRPISRAR